MHVRRKNKSWLQSATEQVADPGWRHDVLDQAADAATQLTTEIVQRANDLGSQAGERVAAVADTISNEAQGLLSSTDGDGHSKHRVRKFALLAGAGALIAYFFHPQNGRTRREDARRRTSSSARHLGNGLGRAAHVAHEAADVASTDAKRVPEQSPRTESVRLATRPAGTPQQSGSGAPALS